MKTSNVFSEGAHTLMDDITRKTLVFRHRIIRMITPKLVEECSYYKATIEKLLTFVPRPMTLFLKSMDNDGLVGVEIGVAGGKNALSMLQELRIKQLFLIDPYPYKISSYQESMARSALSKFPEAVFIKKTSEEALNEINELLDFVYIDGNHEFRYVKKDIELHYSIVKSGGVIGGHDYTVFNEDGVVKAVNRFAQQHKVNLQISLPDWWIVKP